MKPKFGIVCVHGIGRQAQGQTTRDVAMAVQRGAESLGGSVVEAEGEANVAPGARVLDVSLPDCDPIEVVLHDGRWDHLVEPPPWRSVLLWMLRVAPFTIWLTMAGWVNDILDVQERNGRTHPLLQILPAGAVMLVPIVAPLMMLLALLATPVVLVNRRFSAVARTIVSAWIGDAWMYRSDRLDDTAIASVRELVENVRQNADAVIMVGHSQGAEIGRRAAIDTNVDTCVWVGSGEFPLGILRMLRRSPGVVVALWAVLLTFPMVFALVLTAMWNGLAGLVGVAMDAFTGLWPPRIIMPDELGDRADAVSRGFLDFAWSGLGEVAFLLAYFGVAAFLIVRMANAPRDQQRRPDCEVAVVKSLMDPVCLGPRDDADFVRYVPVSRVKNWWREHVAYFDKPETGKTLIEAMVGANQISHVPHVPKLGVAIHVIGGLAAGAMAYALWALGTWMLTLLPF
ncbi:hypothetical protein [Paramicrobacterium chengjingii]|uniref:Uncharacterized protein n=1 Tax=Paramicrobacterium chengjingii TaxID=2769067 RepID=A0ABX6YGW0_9MICO|nr:hypothetical protein [Microbacterium chengjingii]QPZ38021.1 hypothetical protein HCR76_14655 [Microbacterium chengjingii]